VLAFAKLFLCGAEQHKTRAKLCGSLQFLEDAEPRQIPFYPPDFFFNPLLSVMCFEL
jgi:hypothetical protein